MMTSLRLSSLILAAALAWALPAAASDIGSTNYSETAASNNAAPPNGWPAGMNPAQVHPAAREMMAGIKRWFNRSQPIKTSAGTANVQTLTYDVAESAYVTGEVYSFLVGAGLTNTGATTLNVNALGAKAVQRSGNALTGGELIAGEPASVYYDGTQFQILTLPSRSSSPSSGSGFVNRLRNATLISQSYGTTITVTSGGAWVVDGLYCLATGADITASVLGTNALSPALTINSISFAGAVGNTNLTCRWVIESYDAIHITGKTVTFQLPLKNGTGSSLTPTVTAKYPTAQDNYAATTTDLATASMQALADTATGTEAYTWQAAASGPGLGYEIIVSFGALTTGSVTIGGGFDFRATPGTATGLNPSPPPPEIRDLASDVAWNKRFYHSTYQNGTAAGTLTTVGEQGIVNNAAAGTGSMGLTYNHAPMRCGSVVGYSPITGATGKAADAVAGVDVNVGFLAQADDSFFWFASPNASSFYQLFAHFVIDCTISGG